MGDPRSPVTHGGVTSPIPLASFHLHLTIVVHGRAAYPTMTWPVIFG